MTGHRHGSRKSRSRDSHTGGVPIYTRASRRRRGVGIWLLLLAVVVFVGALLLLLGESETGDQGGPEGRLRVVSGPTVLLDRPVEQPAAKLQRALRALPQRRRERRGVAEIVLQTNQPALRRAVARTLQAGGGVVELPERAVAARARLPIIKQALRNNCETAALSMLLASRGVKAEQLRLQEQLARSGPLDPQQSGGETLWGDPDRGFVGRPDGGGTSGGYGVYAGPVRNLARRHGVKLRNVSGGSPGRIYSELLSGRPVMIWVGLKDGPFRSWRTLGGRRVTGNFGEHTVVLTGLEGQTVAVNDPLTGQRIEWTRDQFEEMWQRLGRRALALPTL